MALLALVPACIVFYRIMPFTTANRTRELGLRIALGSWQHSKWWQFSRCGSQAPSQGENLIPSRSPVERLGRSWKMNSGDVRRASIEKVVIKLHRARSKHVLTASEKGHAQMAMPQSRKTLGRMPQVIA